MLEVEGSRRDITRSDVSHLSTGAQLEIVEHLLMARLLIDQVAGGHIAPGLILPTLRWIDMCLVNAKCVVVYDQEGP